MLYRRDTIGASNSGPSNKYFDQSSIQKSYNRTSFSRNLLKLKNNNQVKVEQQNDHTLNNKSTYFNKFDQNDQTIRRFKYYLVIIQIINKILNVQTIHHQIIISKTKTC